MSIGHRLANIPARELASTGACRAGRGWAGRGGSAAERRRAGARRPLDFSTHPALGCRFRFSSRSPLASLERIHGADRRRGLVEDSAGGPRGAPRAGVPDLAGPDRGGRHLAGHPARLHAQPLRGRLGGGQVRGAARGDRRAALRAALPAVAAVRRRERRPELPLPLQLAEPAAGAGGGAARPGPSARGRARARRLGVRRAGLRPAERALHLRPLRGGEQQPAGRRRRRTRWRRRPRGCTTRSSSTAGWGWARRT